MNINMYNNPSILVIYCLIKERMLSMEVITRLQDFIFFLHHKSLAPIDFIEAKMDCLLPVIWCRFILFIVTPQMFMFSHRMKYLHSTT